MENNNVSFPELGFGLGLRPAHYPYIFEHWPQVDWFEVISENFMDTDGRPKSNLARIKDRYPVVMHGVALSIGSMDPLNYAYLEKLKKFAHWLQPAWISDHLCWTGVAHKNIHDLLPLPYREETLKHLVGRIRQVQEYLERPIALENPSTYLQFKSSSMSEAEFIARMVQESGCHLLLDVNNVYVSCYNHQLNPQTYIDLLPLDQVIQIHLSGHDNRGTHIIDTHDNTVVDEVWALYRYVVKKAGRIPNTMVEWDAHIPQWDVLYAELSKAKWHASHAGDALLLPQLSQGKEDLDASTSTFLCDSQMQMQAAILQGITPTPENWIKSKQGFSPADQLAIYVNGYHSRLCEVTAEDYPVLRHYLGLAKFDRLIHRFVDSVHSEHFNIGRYALRLPQFISVQADCNQFAHELCMLETAISQIADLPETQALQPAHLTGITSDTLLELELAPRTALELFEFQYPVNAYYIAVKENEPLPVLNQTKTNWLVVFRHEDVVWRMPLDEYEYHLLSKLFSALPIGQALEAIQIEFNLDEDQLVAQLSGWFYRWMNNGLLSKNSIRNHSHEGIQHENK